MAEQQTDPSRQFKDATREGWNRAAAGWDRQTPHIHHWLANITETMMNAAEVRQGSHVLDVAAGAGEQTVQLAHRVGAQGQVLGIDLSPEILRLAENRARAAGLSQVEFRVGDAENLDVPPDSFDAAVCRLGLMFCPSPLQALQEMHRAVKPGSKVAVIVYSGADANPTKTIPMATARKHAGLPANDPDQPALLTRLGNPAHLQGLFEQAGFQEVRVEKQAVPIHHPTTRDFMEFVKTAMSPVIQLVSTLEPAIQQNIWDDIERQLEVFQTADGWVGPAEMLVASGQKPL